MQTKIRKATEKDIPEIILLEKKLNSFERKINGVSIYRKGFEKSEKRYLKKAIASKKGAAIVAELNGKIVGCLTAKPDTWREKFAFNKWVLIDDLFVEKKFRKKKIATKMLKEAERLLGSGINGFELFVLKGNNRAIALYKKLGYKETVSVMLKRKP